MTHTFKLIILFASIFVYASFGYFWWDSISSSNDKKAWHFFENSHYNMAISFIRELEKLSDAAKYPLYLGYVFREKQDLDQSSAYFKKALKPQKTGSDKKLLLEIYLNLCLNGYLKNDQALFKESLALAKEINNQHENESHLFTAIQAFLEEDYHLALFFFQKHSTSFSLSPWMKSSFEKRFSNEWLKKQIAYCLIEESKFTLAHELLSEEDRDDIHFLRAYSYFKEGSYELASIHLKKIEKREEVAKEFCKTLEKLELELLKSTNGSWERFSNHFLFLQNSLPEYRFDALLVKLEQMIVSNHNAISILQNVSKEAHVKLLDKISKQAELSLKKRDFKQLAQLIDLIKLQSQDFAFIAQKIETLIFTSVNQCQDMDSITALWTALEHSSESSLNFAKKMVSQATNLWLSEQKYPEALKLFETALALPSKEDQPILTTLLEKAFLRFYQRAINEDRIDEHFHILRAAKILNLNHANLYDKQEKIQLIEDAGYFFSRQLYEKAYERASFILLLEPENCDANRIVGLISYVQGDYRQAFKTLEKVKNADKTVLDALQHLRGLKKCFM